MKKVKPNILYIVAHDLGDWLGCYGKEWIKSPHVDQLAEHEPFLEIKEYPIG